MKYRALYIGNESSYYNKLVEDLPQINFRIGNNLLDFIIGNYGVDLIILEVNNTTADRQNIQLIRKYYTVGKTVCFIIKNSELSTGAFIQLGAHDIFNKHTDPQNLWKRFEFIKKHYDALTVRSSEQMNVFVQPKWKRNFDIIVSTFSILLLSPIFLIISALILLESRGSVFTELPRIGTGYKDFGVIIFRNTTQKNDLQKETKVGLLLRKLRILKLPQLINVLRGDMSIVGNRYLTFEEAESLTTDEWSARFFAPVGITGLWRARKLLFSRELTASEMKQSEIDYAKNFSFFLDLKIMLKTLF